MVRLISILFSGCDVNYSHCTNSCFSHVVMSFTFYNGIWAFFILIAFEYQLSLLLITHSFLGELYVIIPLIKCITIWQCSLKNAKLWIILPIESIWRDLPLHLRKSSREDIQKRAWFRRRWCWLVTNHQRASWTIESVLTFMSAFPI